jgi:hypothetical protein
MSSQTDRCGENYCDQNLLEKIICNAKEKGEVGNTVAFALLTAGIAPAFVIALTKSIREKKIAETLPAASLALAGWGLEVVRSVREIRKKCNNQEPELGADEDSSDSDSESESEPPTELQQDVETILNKFCSETQCSKLTCKAISYNPQDNSGTFELYALIEIIYYNEKVGSFTLTSDEMKNIRSIIKNPTDSNEYDAKNNTLLYAEIKKIIKYINDEPSNKPGNPNRIIIGSNFSTKNEKYPNGVVGFIAKQPFVPSEVLCNKGKLQLQV